VSEVKTANFEKTPDWQNETLCGVSTIFQIRRSWSEKEGEKERKKMESPCGSNILFQNMS